MADNIRKDLILENLDCASCAVKIEDQVGKLDNVSKVSLNFTTKTLTIEIPATGDVAEVISSASDIIQKLEPDVMIREKRLITNLQKKILILEGLDCANCAAKIEKAVKMIDGVEAASVDFATGKMSIEAKHRHELSRVVDEATATALQLESGIKIIDPDQAKSDEGKPEGVRTEVILLVSGALLFGTPFIFQLNIWLELALYLASYLIVGGTVLLRAAKNIIRGQIFDENFLMSIATIGALAIGQYPEAVAVMLFYKVGQLFEKLAVGHSRRSISALMDIRPDYANLKVGDG